MTTAGIYLFSQFTHEALLFEALAICGLAATYAGFWVLKKRRLGAIENAVPAHVVKDYLNELIVDAEQLRNQLFGLLSAAGITVNANASRIMATAPAVAANLNPSDSPVDPMALEKMAALEGKIADQTAIIEKYVAEKSRIERELAEARAAGPSTPGKANDVEVVQLRDKIGSLEGKLAEYSVIEDDLANLKRLQQENIQLRAALAGTGTPAPAAQAAASAAATTPAPAPAAAKPAAAPVAAKAPEPAVTAAPVFEAPIAEPAPSLDPLADIAAPTGEPSFEGLVDQVEQSLDGGEAAMPTETPSEPAAAGAARGNSDSTSQPAAGSMGKSDADLVAEFEKMLNS